MHTIARRLRERRITARNQAAFEQAWRGAPPNMRHELDAAAAHNRIRTH